MVYCIRSLLCPCKQHVGTALCILIIGKRNGKGIVKLREIPVFPAVKVFLVEPGFLKLHGGVCKGRHIRHTQLHIMALSYTLVWTQRLHTDKLHKHVFTEAVGSLAYQLLAFFVCHKRIAVKAFTLCQCIVIKLKGIHRIAPVSGSASFDSLLCLGSAAFKKISVRIGIHPVKDTDVL